MINRRSVLDKDIEILGLRLAPDGHSFLMRYAVEIADLYGVEREVRTCRVAMYGDYMISRERITQEAQEVSS